MNIDRLLDFYEDVEVESYFLQKKRLMEGVVLDYSFLRFDPFKGLKRKNNTLLINDTDVDSGIYSFLINSDLFFVINPNVSVRMNFEYILLFSDEYYEVQLSSGGFKTKVVTLQREDLLKTTAFEQDELISNLIKHKNIKISLKLKEPGKSRLDIERKMSIDNTEGYAEVLLEKFVSKVTSFQLEREKIYLYLDVLSIPHSKDEEKDSLIKSFKNIRLNNLNIKKNVLYMNLLFNRLYKSKSKETAEQILSEVESKYNSKIKKIKLLEYKLKSKYITIRDRND